ncbi:MAG: hypothetical protein MJD61_21965 [Proteobacteria bacterium]|nr:hypothetical protein [Pseudomonadota bacterium]
MPIGSDLRRAEALYREARYESALVWLRELERDEGQMEAATRVDFHYLRGITAFRLGMRDDALHFLAIARELPLASRLRPSWRETLRRTLAALTADRAFVMPDNPPRNTPHGAGKLSSETPDAG